MSKTMCLCFCYCLFWFWHFTFHRLLQVICFLSDSNDICQIQMISWNTCGFVIVSFFIHVQVLWPWDEKKNTEQQSLPPLKHQNGWLVECFLFQTEKWEYECLYFNFHSLLFPFWLVMKAINFSRAQISQKIREKWHKSVTLKKGVAQKKANIFYLTKLLLTGSQHLEWRHIEWGVLTSNSVWCTWINYT